MTCAECQGLLLDLSYGELPPDRAAEVERHVAGCPTCREERAAIDAARRLVAPLRTIEEPSPGFDERILAAARAEATMQADGTPGQIVEVTATVKPLGLQPARVDPRADVNIARRPPRARWLRRAAVAGSVAAAAGLALVVGISLRRPALEEIGPVPELKIRAPVVGSVVDEAREKALPSSARNRDSQQAPARSTGSGGDAAPLGGPTAFAPAPGAAPILLPAPAPPPKHRKALAKQAAPAAPAPDSAAQAEVPPAAPARDSPAQAVVPPDAKLDDQAVKKRTETSASTGPGESSATALSEGPKTARSDAAGTADGAHPRSSEQASNRALLASRPPEAAEAAPAQKAKPSADPHGIESSAETSRRAGRYQAAAQLYRDAAAARRAAGDETHAAWNLAHVVECLAAASLLEEAARARSELLRDYPGQDGPRRAADRALNYPPPPPEPTDR